jgi:S-adenosyl-L-methionine hydrolase (adenosine-forming)
MEPRPLITLTTDFGCKDPFVGIMKGVILTINPFVRIVDITHDISPQNISEAVFALEVSFRSFPHNTIHIAVVDPGVGSERRPLLVATAYHYFIGPDNGIFSRIYAMSERLEVYHLRAGHYFLPERSSTFDGRDVFAPVAAWFSKGIDVQKFGDRIFDYVTIPLPVSKRTEKDIVEGEVVYVDRFGNLMTNIDIQQIKDLSSNYTGNNLTVAIKGMEAPLKKYYSEGTDNKLYSLINSFGYLELFVNRGSSSANFGIIVGEKVRILLK